MIPDGKERRAIAHHARRLARQGHNSVLMDEPRISVGLPQLLDEPSADVVKRFAARAEELGFAGLWSLDSVPGSATARVPLLDGPHVLTTAAAVTSTIGLGIAVIVLAARNAPQLAKELATIDRLSDGRLTVGIGVGRHEPTAAGLGLARWAARAPASGGHRPARPLGRRRGDLRRRVLPICGRDGRAQAGSAPGTARFARQPAGARRAARLGDGWLAAGSSASAAFTDQMRIVVDELRDAGRDADTFAIGKRVYIAVEDTEQRARDRCHADPRRNVRRPGTDDVRLRCGPPRRGRFKGTRAISPLPGLAS